MISCRACCNKYLPELNPLKLPSRKLTWKPQKGPIKTTVLLKGGYMSFHVSLGECTSATSAHGSFVRLLVFLWSLRRALLFFPWCAARSAYTAFTRLKGWALVREVVYHRSRVVLLNGRPSGRGNQKQQRFLENSWLMTSMPILEVAFLANRV